MAAMFSFSFSSVSEKKRLEISSNVLVFNKNLVKWFMDSLCLLILTKLSLSTIFNKVLAASAVPGPLKICLNEIIQGNGI
jgi:hypothetical protein